LGSSKGGLSFYDDLMRIFIFSVVFIQVLLSFFILPRLGVKEIFPFHHWNLFSRAEPETVIYRLKIHTSETQSCWLEDCSFVRPHFFSSKSFALIRNAGLSEEDGPERDQLEAWLAKAVSQPSSYEVIKARINVNDFSTQKKMKEETVVYAGRVN
jgi:hypothetical protein